MSAVVIQTFAELSRVIYPSANVTSASITYPVPTITPPNPANGGILEIAGDALGGKGAVASVKMEFFGLGADATTFIAYVFGWELVPSSDNVNSGLWVPTELFSLTGIGLDSGMPGVANTPVIASQFFATALTLGVGNSGIGVEVVSPGHGKGIAHVVASIKGPRFLEARFETGGSATSCNGLWKVL